MGLTLQIVALLLCSFAAISSGKHSGKQNSRLMMEFHWPDPKNLKRLPHGGSCSHFYLNKPDGSQVMKKCPGDEVFDILTFRCREKSSAKCWTDLLKKGNSKNTRRHFRCPFPWGLYPDVEDCSKFYDCLSGKPYARQCPDSTFFDMAERTCVEKNEAVCADVSDVVEPYYRCPFRWGDFTYSKDCSKYYECLRKVPSLRSCKKNFLFDNFERKCLPVDNVKCGERFNPYEKGNKSTTKEVLSSEVRTAESIFSRTEMFETERTSDQVSVKHSPTVADETTRRFRTTGAERVTTERIPTGAERATTERIPTKAEQVTTERIPTRAEQVTTERIHTGAEHVTTERIPTGPERVTTERIPTRAEQVTTERIPTGAERVTTERIPTGAEQATTERIPTGPERVTTERIPTRAEQVTTERIPTGAERVTTERIPTGAEQATTERIPTVDERVTTKRIHTRAELVTRESIPTGAERITTERISTGAERVTTERIPTGAERITTKHIHTGYERVTTERE